MYVGIYRGEWAGARMMGRQRRAKPEPAWRSGPAKCHATPRSGLIPSPTLEGTACASVVRCEASNNGGSGWGKTFTGASRCPFGTLGPSALLVSAAAHIARQQA